ncbi:MAG: GTP 3',8-cyclase MoaA [Spirochaetaceae bacterium]|nr:GTP 3',8-cyclase MoaA [Spirochaetaceae bacterium]
MQDGFGRHIDYLRISVTDRCSLRCVYCMPPEGVKLARHADMLSLEEILKVCEAAARLGINKFKITGGEPLERRGLTSFIHSLKRQSGVKTVTLTSNGAALCGFLDGLQKAGLDAVNISLDTLRPAVFRRITRSDGLENTLRAIEDVRKTPLALKINCVPLRGVNEDDIVPLAMFARHPAVTVRFIELMPLGLGAAFSPVPQDEVFARLRGAFGGLTPCGGPPGNGPASYYSAAGLAGKIGFISALSRSFCASCNRLRLTSMGLLKPCLSSDLSVDLKSALRGGGRGSVAGGGAGANAADIPADCMEKIEEAIRAAVMIKPAGHDFHAGGSRHKNKDMFRIGG